MDALRISGAARTPEIHFEPTGVLKLAGRSIPENAVELYRPALEWVDEYVKSPAACTTLNMQLEYFNTSSSKVLLNLFKRLAELSESGATVEVKWYYAEDDEDMMEAGEDFRQIVKLPFELVAR